jgi:hypothetical protein
MGLDGVKLSVRRSFYFAWITSLFGAAATYYLLARFFPQKSYVMNKNEKWGEWTQDKVEAWGAARRRGDRDGAESRRLSWMPMRRTGSWTVRVMINIKGIGWVLPSSRPRGC